MDENSRSASIRLVVSLFQCRIIMSVGRHFSSAQSYLLVHGMENGVPLPNNVSMNNRKLLWIVLRACDNCWAGIAGATFDSYRDFIYLVVEISGPNTCSEIISSSAEKGLFNVEFSRSNCMHDCTPGLPTLVERSLASSERLAFSVDCKYLLFVTVCDKEQYKWWLIIFRILSITRMWSVS